VSEGRVADIMAESQSFGQCFIQPQYRGHSPSDLSNLECMRKAIARMVGIRPDEDLGLIL
jgi:hypothetical protein